LNGVKDVFLQNAFCGWGDDELNINRITEILKKILNSQPNFVIFKEINIKTK